MLRGYKTYFPGGTCRASESTGTETRLMGYIETGSDVRVSRYLTGNGVCWFKRNPREEAMEGYKEYICVVCGFVYNEKAGLPEEGIKPGTRWDDIPNDWVCPECGAGKEDFEMVEI